ncbi:MAG: hypothetical protein QME12_01595, partial [Nanoarchaeota archaeon]|nr:hypothetical protein [Nanoarchaeota archaeon]
MRLILTLEPLTNSAYDMQYYNKLQGFLYNLIRNTEFDVLHEKEGYKFFCFSNIFPFGENKPGKLKKLVISSPSSAFISFIGERLRLLMEDKKEIRIGETLFKMDKIQRISPKVQDGCTISASTPITL